MPQLIPAGLLVTVPEPVPLLTTERETIGPLVAQMLPVQKVPDTQLEVALLWAS